MLWIYILLKFTWSTLCHLKLFTVNLISQSLQHLAFEQNSTIMSLVWVACLWKPLSLRDVEWCRHFCLQVAHWYCYTLAIGIDVTWCNSYLSEEVWFSCVDNYALCGTHCNYKTRHWNKTRLFLSLKTKVQFTNLLYNFVYSWSQTHISIPEFWMFMNEICSLTNFHPSYTFITNTLTGYTAIIINMQIASVPTCLHHYLPLSSLVK